MFPTRRSSLIIAFCIASSWLTAGSNQARATHLHASATSTGVSVPEFVHQISIARGFVSGVVEIHFEATSGERNAGTLHFPLPPGAVLHRAELYLPAEQRWEPGETLGRREAKAASDDIMNDNPDEDPLMVEQIGLDYYRAHVYPIRAGEQLKIRIHYAHRLERGADGTASLQIAARTPEPNPGTRTQDHTVVVALEPGACSTARWQLPADVLADATIDCASGQGLVQAAGYNMGTDWQLVMQMSDALENAGVIRYVPTEGGFLPHHYAHWIPEFPDDPALRPGTRNVVFVVDRSGSMAGSKLKEARRATQYALQSLQAGDLAGLVAFNAQAQPYLGAMFDVSGVQNAVQWIEGLTAESGTDVQAGLSTALDMAIVSSPHREVDLILLSDGLPSVGIKDAGTILANLSARAQSAGVTVRITGLGIGIDLDQSFLNSLVQATGGKSLFALEDWQIVGDFTRLMADLRLGGLRDVELGVLGDGLSAHQVTAHRLFAGAGGEWAALGPIQDALTLELRARHQQEQFVLRSDALVPESLAFGLDQLAAPLAAKVWANELEREIDTQGETLARVIEAVLLAKRYGIVTRYSAILALESDELYRSLDIQQIRRDPAGIALDPPEISKADEKRIGANGGDGDGDGDGDGGDDSSWDGNGGDDGQNSGGGDGGDDQAVDEGFSDGGCRASRGTGSLPAWLLLAAVGLACRPRRRALARWACAQAAGNDQSATPAH